MDLKSAKVVETNRVELEVEVDGDKFNDAINKVYRRNVKNMNIPGFRKGKAPRHLIEKMYGESVFHEEAINDIYPEALNEAIEESGYEYIDDKIDLDVTEVDKDGFTFKAVVTVKPEVEIGEYKGLKATKVVEDVTEEDIKGEIDTLLQRNSRLATVEDRGAKIEDTVVLDFDGYVDDVAFEGGKAENHTLELGSGQFIPGFEEQVVDKKTGEEFDVKVTFPEEYQTEELAGKDAVFKCKLHEIKVREFPELDDEFAKDVSEFDTLDELKKDLSDKALKQRQDMAEREVEEQLIDGLIDGLKAEIPEAMFEIEIDHSVRDFSNQLQGQGLNMDMYMQYTGMDMESFKEGFREQAEKQVKTRLALEKIAKDEKIEISDEDMEKEYADLSKQHDLEVDRIKGIISTDNLKRDMSVAKAMDIIKENAKIEETNKKPEIKEEKPKAAKTTKKAETKKTTSKKEEEKEEKPKVKKPAKKAVDEKADKKEEKQL